jgi:hypothetical protein
MIILIKTVGVLRRIFGRDFTFTRNCHPLNFPYFPISGHITTTSQGLAIEDFEI